MQGVTELDTPRLRLRRWRDADRAPFAALNADPEVMRFYPSTLSAAESDAMVDRIEAGWDGRGWGLWAVERRDGGAFIGFVGLSVPPRPLPCMPCVEIGWRLARAHWRQGFATEAARAALRTGFETIGLDEIVSFTSTLNAPSMAVMRRLGMHRDASEDFDHPAVPEGSALRRHVLYRLSGQQWRDANAGARALSTSPPVPSSPPSPATPGEGR